MIEVIAKQLEDLDDVAVRAFFLDRTIQSHPDRKILIILDHMFWKLNLKALGINSAKNCKLLVVSREKNVCEEMGAKEDDVLEMKPLEEDEARHLFWTQVFVDKEAMVNQVTNWKYVNLGDKLLRDYARCLPLVVKALAKAVKDQNLFQWESFAKKLADKGHEVFHSISDINIQLLDDKREKKMFFLLACLFPQELSIPIQELMRYAMGLDLIQCVNNLTEAITQAYTWAHELISSSLLEADGNSNSNNYLLNVFIHHLVLERANSLLVKEKEKFLVPAIPRWHTEETCQEYTAISLMPASEHSRLDGFHSKKLKMLLLNHSKPVDQFSGGFFKGMLNLKILVLKGMTMKPKVPSSINQLLKMNLRLLSLEDCDLGTFESIDAKNVNLVVLNFRESTMEELPVELVEKCHVLRLLDLSKCNISKKGIPADVLKRLSQLEGLYAYGCFDNWASESYSSEYCANISELNYLSYLNVLEMNVRHLQQWPIQGEHIVQQLKQFHICVGSRDQGKSGEGLYRRILQLHHIDTSSIISYSWLKILLRKCEMLKVQEMEKLQQFIRDDDNFKFPFLQNLHITTCFQMQCFSSTPFKAQYLDTLTVDSCDNLKCFFEELNDQVEFPTLKLMRLSNMQNMKTVLAESNRSTTCDDLQGQEHQDPAFFHEKVLFPSLEELRMEGLDQIANLWDVKCKEHDYIYSFNNLKTIYIKNCAKLEGLASLLIADTLEQLKEFTIYDCPKIREVITNTDNENDLFLKNEEDEEQVYQIFPSLEKLSLVNCPNLQVFLSGYQNLLVELQSLHTLEIVDCPEMMSLSSEFLIKAPNLCQVKVDDCYHLIEDSNDIDSSLRKYLQDLHEPSEQNLEENNTGKERRKSKDGCGWSNMPCVRSACFEAS